MLFCLMPSFILAEVKPLPDSVFAVQPEGNLQILTTQDGDRLIGRVIQITDGSIEFQLKHGKMTIEKSQVKSIKTIPSENIVKDEYWFPNPNASRLLFAPTAFTLAKGETYLADYYVFFPMVGYGVTDKFTLAGGISFLPSDQFFTTQIISLAPKYQLYKNKNAAFALGFLAMDGFGDLADMPTIGIMYGVSTIGNTNSNATIGLGYGFVKDKLADKPVVVIGGESRTSRSMSLITENWFVPGVNNVLASFGVRWLFEASTIDFALMTALGTGGAVPIIPWLDFSINF
jgi:hypothetical protein